jgi:dipeptidase E
MKLVLYGGGDHDETRVLDKRLISLCGHKTPKITFIPSYVYDADIDFQDFVLRFSKLGIRRFINFPIDVPFDDVLLDEALSSDVIYLDGGNTYYFLNHLRKSRMISKLKKFVAKGGVLAGLSAGAILMTPHIATAGFPPFDCDENYDKIRNLNALGLVPFEFFPHYKNSKRYNDALIAHSKQSSYHLFALADGQGIIITEKGIDIVNQATMFYQGHKYKKINFDHKISKVDQHILQN